MKWALGFAWWVFACAAGPHVKCSRHSWVISAYSKGEEAFSKLMKPFKGDNSTGTHLGIWKRLIHFGVGKGKDYVLFNGMFSADVLTLRSGPRRVQLSHFPVTLSYNQQQNKKVGHSTKFWCENKLVLSHKSHCTTRHWILLYNVTSLRTAQTM